MRDSSDMPGTTARATGLTVAVTGPTGQVGHALISSLERAPEVGLVKAMARRPVDSSELGWQKVSYRRGDVLDREAVAGLVAEADVVVHLAFSIMGGARESRRVNREGSRNVFQAAVAAGAKRLIYTSSVAAYGFDEDAALPVTEESPTRGTSGFRYSADKAQVESLLLETLAGSSTAAYVFRPCIVGGPDALLLVETLPYVMLSQRLPGPLTDALGIGGVLRPVLPDPGVPFQLVHHDDVAAAMRAAVLGRGRPGPYNLAGAGEITFRTLASELGWYSIPAPRLAVDAAAEMILRLDFLPAQAQWVAALRRPVIMKTTRARRELNWRPRHNALDTLRETIEAARRSGLLH